MAGSYWIKFYHETLDDPKVARLPDTLWRRFFECCLLAGEVQQAGILPSIPDIAWKLRVDEETVKRELSQLAKHGLLEHRIDSVAEEGQWVVVNFARRQAPMSAAERQRRHREKERRAEYHGHKEQNDSITHRDTDSTAEADSRRNGAVTNRDTDIDREKEKEKEGEVDADQKEDVTNRDQKPDQKAKPLPAAAPIFSAYEANIGPLTPHITERIGDYLDARVPASWLVEAFEIAAENNKRAWSYSKAIIDRWMRDGKDSGRGRQTKEDLEHKALLDAIYRYERK